MFGLIVQTVTDMKLYVTFVVHCGVLLMHKELVVTKCCSSV